MKQLVTVFLVAALVGLSACSSNFDMDETEVEEIKVSFFKDFGSVNEDNHMTIREKEEIKEGTEKVVFFHFFSVPKQCA
ncbi:hypothetical protein [Evansella cellulosilytica]|uniref:Uncharacterized protein n=1 Tax=Evansella cellulosilytica (strain ATCC 21833 / DSM 2522 / FERM P-1141 / JCM 9156 / N-4) TaxID=649639 RepID=E6TRX1_EVAC2|nr:hypothetical protein [Evansella cellulosilytica]ADU29494.1 hypothetical protein Bcell_1229 [Evansella cellulosilytica DSM 2522]